MQKNGTELLAALNAGGLQPQTEQDILAKNAHTASHGLTLTAAQEGRFDR